MLVKSDIIGILNDAFEQTAKLRKGGDQAMYFCPFCHHAKRKLEICLEEGSDFSKWHCWICDSKGSNLGTLLWKLNAPMGLRNQLFALTGDIRIQQEKPAAVLNEVILPSEFSPMSKVKRTPDYKRAMQYLKTRGFRMEDVLRYNIGYCESGEYKNHVILPSYDANNKLNFFIGRRFIESRWHLSHKKPNVSMNIIGCELLLNYNEPIILVESFFNAVTVRRNSCPLFGKYPSKKLYESLIINRVKKVYVCLDADAEKSAIYVCEQFIRLGITPYIVTLKGGKDPNEIGFEKTWECINNSREVDFSFLLKKQLRL